MTEWFTILYFIFAGLLFIFAEKIAKWDIHDVHEDSEPVSIRDWIYGIAVSFFAAVVASMIVPSFNPRTIGLGIVGLVIAFGALVPLLYFWLGNKHITAKRAAVIVRILAIGLALRAVWELLR